MTDKFEGCVVREMRRLDELMKNLHLAAKVTHHSQTCTEGALSIDLQFVQTTWKVSALARMCVLLLHPGTLLASFELMAGSLQLALICSIVTLQAACMDSNIIGNAGDW